MKLILSSLMLGGAAVGYPALQEPDTEPATLRLVSAQQENSQSSQASDEKKRALEEAAKELQRELEHLENELADMRSQVQRERDQKDIERNRVRQEAGEQGRRARAERLEGQAQRRAEASVRRAMREAEAEVKRAEARAQRRVAGAGQRQWNQQKQRDLVQREVELSDMRDRMEAERQRDLAMIQADQEASRRKIEREVSVLRDQLAAAKVEAEAARGRIKAVERAGAPTGGAASGRVRRPQLITAFGSSPGSSSASGSVINITVEEGDVHIHAGGAEIRTTKPNSAGGAFKFNASSKPPSGFFFEIEEEEEECEEDEGDGPARFRFGSLNDEGNVYFLDTGSGTGVKHLNSQALEALKKSTSSISGLKKLAAVQGLEDLGSALDLTDITVELSDLKDTLLKEGGPVSLGFKVDLGGLPGKFMTVDGESAIELNFEDVFETEEIEEKVEIEFDTESAPEEHGDHRFVWHTGQAPNLTTGSWLQTASTSTSAPRPDANDDELVDIALSILNELRGMRADLQEIRDEVASGTRSYVRSARATGTSSR